MQRPATERSPLLGRTRGAARRLDRLRANRTALAAFAGAALLVAAVFALRRETSAPAPAAALADDPTEFDVIVVGGGPAGSVVAKLLSDDPWRRVLLIEAGDASQVELGGTHRINATANTANLTPFDVPFYWTSVANTPSLHWDYPDVNVAKALGGCGIHNAMLYVRALPSDLSRWNMPEWTWEKALEIYMRMESFDGPNVSYHGTRGSVRTSPPPPPDPLSEAFVQACEDAGLPRTVDFNAPSGRHGAGFYHFNTRGGIRESAARRFLGPILKAKRQNFKLQLKTHVKRVILNDDLAATGVEIVNAEGSQQTLKLTKTGQVIITAGAINTPKLLLLSGLGHREDLAQLGIPVKKHLARVGMNLQDHPVLAMTFESPEAVKSIDLESAMDMYLKATQDPAANASSYGMMGSAGISAGAFLTSPGATIPDIQLTFFPRKSEPHVSNSSQLNHDPQILITVALLNPSARNRIVLTNVNGTDDITPRVISEVPDQEAEHLRPDDVRKLAWGVGVVREITAALARKGVVGREIWPGSSVVSEDDLLKWVPSAVFRNSHWVGSAAMGHNDETGVVDSHLRVFGARNLRVADASVIPKIPNGNVHSSVLMVASHAVQLIREEEQR